MYIYHRLALGGMHQDAAKSRVILTEALTNMEKVNMAYPNAMITQIFVNAKALELTEIFKRGTPEEKDIFSRVLMRIDAPNADRYRDLLIVIEPEPTVISVPVEGVAAGVISAAVIEGTTG